MRVRGIVAFVAIFLCGFSETGYSQDCNDIDAVTTASFKITGGQACSDYANLDWTYRRSNGEMNIEWGTSQAYGSQKSVYESKPIRLTGLTPNTTYYYHVWGIWRNSTYEYTKSSFTTAGGTPPNEPPQITSDEAVSCTTETAITYTITAEDPDQDVVTFSVENLPDWITLNGETLTFEPTSESSDTELKIIASDGKEGLDTLDLTVTVVHVTSVTMQRNMRSPVTLFFGKTRLNVPAAYGQSLTIALYSLNGSRIMRKVLKVTEGMNTGSLLPEAIVPGIYLVRVNSTAGAGSYTIGIQ
ncbi:MAG: hypothetical protein OQK82_06335 [Candidatus Pacearchaeota archaeon]|nr:hypothetical protein [Candidatus Pacearchaeota archaeon]